jgi:hypothetical protein
VKGGDENLHLLFTRMTLHTSQSHRLFSGENLCGKICSLYQENIRIQSVPVGLSEKSESAHILFNNFNKYILQFIYILYYSYTFILIHDI